MQAYKNELMTYFLENYQNFDQQKVTELNDLKRRISDKEELWLELSHVDN